MTPDGFLTGLDRDAFSRRLSAFLRKHGQPDFRKDQIAGWIYRKFVPDFAAMRTIPASLRGELEKAFTLHPLTLDRRTDSDDGATKFLFATQDARPVESVVLPVSDGATYCLSVSSGCPLRCSFCLSGTFFHRHLKAAEIIDQYLLLRSSTGDTPRFSGIVLMGMGEPLLNWEETRRFLRIIHQMGGVGARRITVSTVGVEGRIEMLGKSFPQVKLAVSLHAPTQELRTQLVPYSASFPLQDLLAACRKYAALTNGNRITFEYVLLAGVNDTEEHARRLGGLLQKLPAAVNLIPYNGFPGSGFRRPSMQQVHRFQGAARRAFHGEVTIRKSLGGGAQAACGQLGAAPDGKAIPREP